MTVNEQNIDQGDVADVGAALAPTDAAQLAKFNEHVANLATEETVDVQERILRKVLQATTAEDILRADEALPAAALENVPIKILSIRASESGYEEGADYYLHVDALVIGNGDKVTFSCGASDVAMKLIALDMHGLLPVSARLERAKRATKAGFFPLFLRPLDADGEPF